MRTVRSIGIKSNANGTYGPFSNNRYVSTASEVAFTERFQSSQTMTFHICSWSA